MITSIVGSQHLIALFIITCRGQITRLSIAAPGILIKSRELVGRVVKYQQRQFALLLKELYKIQDLFTLMDDDVLSETFRSTTAVAGESVALRDTSLGTTNNGRTVVEVCCVSSENTHKFTYTHTYTHTSQMLYYMARSSGGSIDLRGFPRNPRRLQERKEKTYYVQATSSWQTYLFVSLSLFHAHSHTHSFFPFYFGPFVARRERLSGDTALPQLSRGLTDKEHVVPSSFAIRRKGTWNINFTRKIFVFCQRNEVVTKCKTALRWCAENYNIIRLYYARLYLSQIIIQQRFYFTTKFSILR